MPSSLTARTLLAQRAAVAGRELEPEGRALALHAGEADAAAVGLDDLARDGQAEADAGDAARLRLTPEELGEDAGLMLFADAESLGLDLDPDHVARRRPTDHDLPPSRRILDRVHDQVDDDLR